MIFGSELSVDELLDDEAVRSLMERDGVNAWDVRELLHKTMHAISSHPRNRMILEQALKEGIAH